MVVGGMMGKDLDLSVVCVCVVSGCVEMLGDDDDEMV